MKKTLRTYTKRTVAVFMAALMLLTAWVFVAPQKAAAAVLTSQDAGSYSFTVTFKIDKNGTNNHDSGWGQTTEDTFIIAARTKKNNGRNSATYTYDYWTSTGSKTWSGGGKQAYDGGFPDGFYMMGNDNSVFQGVKADITKIVVSGKTVWTGTMHVDSTTNEYHTYVYASGQGTDGGNDSSYGYTKTTTKDWPMPEPVCTFNGETSVTTNENGVQKTYSIATAKDKHYGVNWGFSSVEWSSNHDAASINNDGVATFGNNEGVDYDVTFTPKLKHSSGDRTATGITVHVTTDKKLDVNGYLYTTSKDSGADSGSLGGKALATVKVANQTVANQVNDFYQVVGYNKAYEISVTPIAGWKMAGIQDVTSGITYTANPNTDSQIKVTGTMTHTATSFRFAMRPKVLKLTLDKNYTTVNGVGNSDGTTAVYYKFEQKAAQDTSYTSTTGTYFSNGSNSGNTVTGKLTKITTPKRAGYTFDGYWTTTTSNGQTQYVKQYIDENGDFIEDTNGKGAFNTLTADTTLKAKWIPIEGLTITYQDMNGKFITSATGKVGSKADVYTPAPEMPAYPTLPGGSGTFDYVPEYWYIVNADEYYVESNGTQNQRPDSSLVGGKLSDTNLKGNAVFQPYYAATQHNYTVNFYDGATGSNPVLTKGDYRYQDPITQPPRNERIVASDEEFDYQFLGWASQLNSADRRYFLEPDSDLDNAGVAHPCYEAADFVVRYDMNLVAVYQKIYREYTVTFEYRDAVGEELEEEGTYRYGEEMNVPVVPNAVETPPGSYTKDGNRYMFEGWTGVINGQAVSGTPTTCVGAGTYTQHWSEEGTPTTYLVTFYDYDGTLLRQGTFNYNESFSELAAEANANVTKGYTNQAGDKRMVFSHWDPLLPSNPDDMVVTRDYSFTPQYAEKDLHTVTFINGEEDILGTGLFAEGETIITPEGLSTPVRPADGYASDYTFNNVWSRTPYNPKTGPDANSAVMIDDDLTVYAHYDRVLSEYTVNFIYDENGEMVDHKQEHLIYGDEVDIPGDDDVAKDPDDTYSYEFIGWDRTPSATCQGNATYTAQYRKSYVYYDATWYQPDQTQTLATLTVGEGDDAETYYYYPAAEATVHTEKYVYNSIIYTPPRDPDPVTATVGGQALILSGWLYNDGTKVILSRSDRVNNANTHLDNKKLSFIPFYELGDNVRTVTFMKDDTEYAVKTVRAGTLFKNVDYGRDPVKSSDETGHFSLSGWELQTGENTWSGVELDGETPVNTNIVVRAMFAQQAHTYSLRETTTMPTFLADGEGMAICSVCSYRETVVLPKLTDEIAPEGRVIVKGISVTSRDEVASAETTEIPVAAENLFIVNTTDSAAPIAAQEDVTVAVKGTERSVVLDLPAYNATEEGSGTGKIELYVSKDKLTETEISANGIAWATPAAFDYDSFPAADKPTQANYSAALGSLIKAAEIEHGEVFYVYVKMTDRVDPSNTSYISTPPLKYDAYKPIITITSTDGGSDATGTMENRAESKTIKVKHCVDATYSFYDEDFWDINVKKNGSIESYVTTDRTLRDAGEYTVIARDAAGNTAYAVVEVVGTHNYKEVVVAPTCTETGESYNICQFCGYKDLDSVQELSATDHTPGMPRIKQPTCLNNGSVTIVCTKCGEQISNWTTTDDLRENGYNDLVSNGEHTWGTAVVVRNATCSAEGEKRYTCTVCGATKSESIDIDPDAHVWYRPVTVPASCTEDGYVYKECKYNAEHKETIETIPMTGHVADTERGWVETDAPTCTESGREVLYCKYHDTVEVEERTKDPLGHDFSILVETVEPSWNGDEPVQGYKTYKCVRCAETENRDFTDPVANVTVTFVVGTTESSVVVAKNSTLNTVTKPDTTKAADETYRYTFAGWKNGDTIVKDNFAITEDVTLVATYTETYINYTVEFFKDDGITRHYINGYAHYGDTVNVIVSDPTKDEDETATYTFLGWKKAVKNDETNKWEPTGDIVDSIVCNGDATYIAVFEETKKTYTVVWADRAGANYVALETLTVDAGDDVSDRAPDLPASTKRADSNGHWVVTGWDQTPDNVLQNMVIRPVEVQESHNYVITNTPADCTNPAKTTYACACGYTYFVPNGKANGHTWTVTERQNPTATSDGYELRECSVCHVEDRVTLPKTGMINVTITVKDSNGNPVSGANVRLYDGNTLVASGTTGGDGKVTLQVPEAKTYRIEIDGNGINSASGSITVGQNGNITGGSVPTVTRPSSGNQGCDCTCHKSGFWPMIFRFFHKIIKMITGEFRCCPDANY